MTRLDLVRRGDGWVLPVAGQAVTRVCFDPHEIKILCRNHLEISIGEPFTLTAPDGCRDVLDSAAPALTLAAALRIMDQVVGESTAFDDGRLEISFADGSRVSVPVGADYEAWNLAGPGGVDGLKMTSLPGGDLAIWHDRRPG